MPNREKVIKALEFCTDQRVVDTCYGECPYAVAEDEYKCLQMKLDALALLKEQEAVEPRVSSVEQRCGNCNKVIEMDGWITCPWCGKPIKWEGR